MATRQEKWAEAIENDARLNLELYYGSIARIADSLENIERTFFRAGPSLAYAFGVMLREDGAEIRIGAEPNGELYVVLDISSRVGKEVEGFFEEHALVWSMLPEAIIRLVKAYEVTIPLVATPDIPF